MKMIALALMLLAKTEFTQAELDFFRHPVPAKATRKHR